MLGVLTHFLLGFPGWAVLPAAVLAWVAVAVHAAALVAMVARARLGESVRWSWYLISAAFAVGVVSTAAYQVFSLGDPGAGWLTWRDAGRGVFVAFAYAGLVLGLRGRVRHWNAGMLIDGSLLTVAVIAVAFQVLLPILVTDVGISVPAAVALLLHQVGDLLLLGTMLAGLAMLGRRADRQWLILLGAVSALVVSNVIHTRLGGGTLRRMGRKREPAARGGVGGLRGRVRLSSAESAGQPDRTAPQPPGNRVEPGGHDVASGGGGDIVAAADSGGGLAGRARSSVACRVRAAAQWSAHIPHAAGGAAARTGPPGGQQRPADQTRQPPWSGRGR